jgi:hypothetical protein
MEKLLTIWPNMAALAGDLGCPYPTVAAWTKRGIPARRLPAIIWAARRKGFDLTFDELTDLTSALPPTPSSAKDAA